ncbi:MAG: 50S ribosomal protein L11 methyltransferase [Rhodothermales bacterium]
MTNVPTLELALTIPFPLHDLLIAELDALGFTGFVQDDEQIMSYIPFSLWTGELKRHVEAWIQQHHADADWREKEIEPQDWNKTWEESIQPIRIPPFYVRPSWAAPEADLIDIVVDPKMSFGTGHHETTRLLLKMMPAYLKPGDKVLDAGTGTAILAIAAVKLQALSVLAFDIDPWVTDNVAENLKLNEVSHLISFRVGTLDVIPEAGFNVVLANINRNVLLEYLKDFAAKVAAGGYLFLSGVLVVDRPMMEEAAAKVGMRLVADDHEGEWWAGIFTHDAS